MGIITKGMGAIMQGVKKRKTLTLSFPKSKPKPPPRKGEVIIKKKSKPSKTKLADTWQDRRIQAINRKIGAGRDMSRGRHGMRIAQHSHYIDEVGDIYKSKAPTKKFIKVFKRNGMH